jgi:four helix bundle protein
MKITRFEDLECWKEARKLVKMVYDAIRANKRLETDLRFSGQFSAAAVSSMSNIAEGFSRETDKEFSRGLWISKGSAAEVQSLSYAALDQDYLSEEVRKAIYDQGEKVASLDSGMIKYLHKSSPRSKRSKAREKFDSQTK